MRLAEIAVKDSAPAATEATTDYSLLQIPKTTTFPVDILPQILKAYVNDLVKQLDTSAAFAFAHPFFKTVKACSTRYKILFNGLESPINIYMVIGADAGFGKSLLSKAIDEVIDKKAKDDKKAVLSFKDSIQLNKAIESKIKKLVNEKVDNIASTDTAVSQSAIADIEESITNLRRAKKKVRTKTLYSKFAKTTTEGLRSIYKKSFISVLETDEGAGVLRALAKSSTSQHSEDLVEAVNRLFSTHDEVESNNTKADNSDSDIHEHEGTAILNICLSTQVDSFKSSLLDQIEQKNGFCNRVLVIPPELVKGTRLSNFEGSYHPDLPNAIGKILDNVKLCDDNLILDDFIFNSEDSKRITKMADLWKDYSLDNPIYSQISIRAGEIIQRFIAVFYMLENPEKTKSTIWFNDTSGIIERAIKLFGYFAYIYAKALDDSLTGIYDEVVDTVKEIMKGKSNVKKAYIYQHKEFKRIHRKFKNEVKDIKQSALLDEIMDILIDCNILEKTGNKTFSEFL